MRLFIILTILFFSVPGIYASGFVDETGDKSGAVDDMNNREMQDVVTNLDRIQKAFDGKTSKGKTVKTVYYKKELTYKIRLREFMVTTVHLPENEIMDGFFLGDSQNFQVEKVGNKDNLFTVWGIRPGGDTNLTVVGKSGHIYSFYLRIDSTKSAFLPNLVYYISDPALKPLLKPEDKKEKQEAKKLSRLSKHEKDYLREIPYVNPKEINYNYRIKGGKGFDEK